MRAQNNHFRCAPVSRAVPLLPSNVTLALDGSPTSRNCGKACARVGMPDSIRVNSHWWKSLDSDAKVCCIAHEIAHTEGVRCERCADTRAGAILFFWGFPRESISATFRKIVASRPTAGKDAEKGFDHAKS